MYLIFIYLSRSLLVQADKMTHFKDNFSRQSDTYLKYRPTYPDELYEYLGSLTEAHQLAWDAGTGNGQAAIKLTRYYKKVYATDPSRQQIKNAMRHNRITYKVEKAEHTGLADHSVDLITAAQALHWFDLDHFYAEVRRVLKDDGIIAAWIYNLPSISPEIDNILQYFHDEVLDGYWLYENWLVDMKYSTIPFPFNELSNPEFGIQKEISLRELLGLLNSWSAVQRYADQNGRNPVDQIEQKLLKNWGSGKIKKPTTWKLTLKVGRC